MTITQALTESLGAIRNQHLEQSPDPSINHVAIEHCRCDIAKAYRIIVGIRRELRKELTTQRDHILRRLRDHPPVEALERPRLVKDTRTGRRENSSVVKARLRMARANDTDSAFIDIDGILAAQPKSVGRIAIIPWLPSPIDSVIILNNNDVEY